MTNPWIFVKENNFRTINLCKIKTDIETCDEENITNDWVLRKLPLPMPQSEIEGGKRRHLFIFCFGNCVAT